MKNLIAVGFVAALAACGGGGKNNTSTTDVMLIDAKPGSNMPDAPVAACSVLTQAGCTTGQKCAWVLSTDPTSTMDGLGAISCAPDGTVAIGGACTIQPAAMGGNDNCKGGGACVDTDGNGATCKSICDNNGGTPACGANQACVTYNGLFANDGVTTNNAGVCDPTCNPITDNDFDGSGTLFTKSGSNCGGSASPTVGCYGAPSSTSTTYFTCGGAAPGSGNLNHRTVIPANLQALNSCMSGYSIAFAIDATGSTNVDCYAFCTPGDAYMGNTAAQNPNGLAPHGCNNNNAVGNFGTKATVNGTTVTNGEHCFYSWGFEQDQDTGAVHKSPTSDTVGYCYDHTKYKYDPAGGTNDTTILPACASLPLTSTTVLAAVDLACVSTTVGGLFQNSKEQLAAMAAKRLRLGIVLPEILNLPKAQAKALH